MVPYSFASTSHFILTFFISFTVVLGATIIGFQKHSFRFFSLFVPSGCPLGLLPLLVLIEFISYLARNVSLGLRLAANILSGHMLLNILSGFAYNIMTSGFVYSFCGFNTLSIYYSIFRFGIRYSFYTSTSFCSFIMFLHQRLFGLTLKTIIPLITISGVFLVYNVYNDITISSALSIAISVMTLFLFIYNELLNLAKIPYKLLFT